MKTSETYRQAGYDLRACNMPLAFTHAKSWQQKAMAEGYADACVDLTNHGGRQVDSVRIMDGDGSVSVCGDITYKDTPAKEPENCTVPVAIFPAATAAHVESLRAMAKDPACSVERQRRLFRKVAKLHDKYAVHPL